ncbi:MAG: S41 family peptidase [Cyclobacteriaceae bacterium]|nr:S41 family peptidase [Cyclobacteriaceae bacterium]MCX7637282.1 S41 family peptidase [Cyclobacteriaceae bacterium]MDW8331261.1 S41 family peptidase [Cyclobacteriaceae bacterium]
MENKPVNTPNQVKLPLIMAIGLATGLLLGVQLGKPALNQEVDRDVQKLREVLTYISEKYVDDISTTNLTDEAIRHLLTKLDPHSAYIPASERLVANEDLRGNFDGIGIEFNIFQDTIVVVAPLSGGPSEAIGIQSGDKIVAVDDKNVAGIGITNAEVMRLLKGPRGTTVKVTIKRPATNDLLEFTITRDKIPQQSVDVSYLLDAQTGYIKISRFSATTYDEFIQHLGELKKQGITRLVLDLQGNPGGYMAEAIKIADEFLPEGRKIVYTRGKDARLDTDANATARGSFEQGPVIVLVNEGSASASEILAGALQDNDRALIAGRRTFGKGLVQHPFDLSDKSELRLTISRYYTPSGRSIQKPYYDEDEYATDILERYKKGEFFHADSIHLNDSLKYTTVGGRVVYGGGGIMPDYFIPLDTTLNSHYLNELYTSTTIQEYTFNYAAMHKDELEKKGLDWFLKNFTVTDAMLNDLVALGVRNKVKPDHKELRDKKMLFRIHIKAQIARKLWGNRGMYPVLNETNEILKQSLKLFDKMPELLKAGSL